MRLNKSFSLHVWRTSQSDLKKKKKSSKRYRKDPKDSTDKRKRDIKGELMDGILLLRILDVRMTKNNWR